MEYELMHIFTTAVAAAVTAAYKEKVFFPLVFQ